MKRIAVIPNPLKDIDGSCVKDVCVFAAKYVESIKMPVGSPEIKLPCVSYDTIENCFDGAELAVIIGGDGSILKSALYASEKDVPIIGVNLGRLGYLAEIERNDLDILRYVFDGNYKVQNRMMLDVILNDNTYTVLNDAVISKGSQTKIACIKLSCNGMPASNFMSDGMIISTPTGSTAYSLSAGGPVIDPLLECICATPVCPHTLTARPLVFNAESTISVSASDLQELYLSIDGNDYIKVSGGDEVIIRKSDKKLKLVIAGDGNFCKTLSSKLSEKRYEN